MIPNLPVVLQGKLHFCIIIFLLLLIYRAAAVLIACRELSHNTSEYLVLEQAVILKKIVNNLWKLVLLQR